MASLAYPSPVVGRRVGSRALASAVALAALVLLGFALAMQLGGTSSPPIRSQEPAVTSPGAP